MVINDPRPCDRRLIAVNRRHFLGACTSLCGFAALGGCGGSDEPAITPAPAPSTSQQLTLRSASLPKVAIAASTQRCMEWCWAACAETIVRAYGANVLSATGALVGQEYFALKLFGGIVCQAANPPMMALAMTDYYQSTTGMLLQIRATSVLQNPLPAAVNPIAINLIRTDRPFSVEIVRNGETSGHFLVVYGIDWWEDVNGNLVGIRGLRVADPFPLVAYAALGIPPPPTYLDASIYQSYSFVGMVWVI